MSTPLISPAEFMSAAPAALSGSSPWAQRYANEIRRTITEHAMYSPRSLQAHLGPSELGAACDRQIVGKLVGAERTNHVSDPWPSILGTATHAWLSDCMTADNVRRGVTRWLTEHRVTPMEGHSGTADLYDAFEQAVVDWKILGDSSLSHIRSASGPPRRYVVQLLLYKLGYIKLGLPVKRVVLAALPRSAATLDGMYVWERQHSLADDDLLTEVFADTERRKILAQAVQNGQLTLNQIPVVPDDRECYFCPLYRPQSATDHGPGCPGTINQKGTS